jgi:hypothetical protein
VTVRDGLGLGGNRVSHTSAEIVQRLENIGVAPEKARNKHPKEQDDERQDQNKSYQNVSFASEWRGSPQRATTRDYGLHL